MTANPSIAVALHYEKQDGSAPRVVAGGRGAIGDKIVETAKAHGVPVENNPGLAAALADVEIGEEIPLDLYKAVAEVLMFILRMSGRVR
jgi:flagellar biosynthesis protein